MRGSLVKNLALLFLVVLLAVLPLFIHRDAEFAGADSRAEEAILELAPDYQPWFKSIWEPPSGEVESLLFALQAALGAGLIGYYIGLVRGQRKGA
ncbi:energy-coupling factor ABC transporter substrate-binding protein [Desulfovirgula thermocuniculi]|uniref:energy-coupling factor ABC transporter substrate-binding protein n=1 Tax=Desulfovirgula thermocuniculi TaxID=348842 RepID=UPI001FDEB73D|nr:energy-coupling factor ABC transporter substrate-binding protein [Desulfovirgula thermocuniculi]